MTDQKQHAGRKRFILLLGVLTLVYALLMPDRKNLVQGYVTILTSPTHLLTDFFELGGLSATFANLAGHLFLAHYLMSRNERSNINGLQIGAVGIFAGHSFFGTHLLNVIPLFLGMVLYAKFTKQSFKLFTTVSLFATALAPFVSYLALHDGWSVGSLLIATGAGVFLGFIAPALAEEFLKFHHGLTLYNYGFTTGVIGMMVVALLPYFGIEVSSVRLLSQEAHPYILAYVLIVLGTFFIVLCRHLSEAIANYGRLLKSTGRVPDDFVSKYGLYPTLLNMCLMTGSYLAVLILCGVTLNGPVLGGLLTILGFSAFGKHPRNAFMVSVGVLFGALLSGTSLGEFRFALPFLFATGLGPIAGSYGMFYGILAGLLHYNISATALQLHQGMSLYNNGFSTGFVAAFLVPIIESFKDHKQYWIRKKSNVNGKK